MNKTIGGLVIVLIILLGGWYLYTRPTAPSGDSIFPRTYTSTPYHFSINLPDKYAVDESYEYQLAPQKVIKGVKFTVPASTAVGTNLGSDTYISVEQIPEAVPCTGNLFLDGIHAPQDRTENGVDYSVASSTGAGAGNRYEETVYALAGSNPCTAVRYFVHYGVIENYEPGTVSEFDQKALLGEFDLIRSTLLLNK